MKPRCRCRVTHIEAERNLISISQPSQETFWFQRGVMTRHIDKAFALQFGNDASQQPTVEADLN